MDTHIGPSTAKRAALWLAKKVAVAVPGVLLSQASQALDTLFNARAPAWKRAVAGAVLIELAELAPTAIPASLALRFVILRAMFEPTSGADASRPSAEG